MAASGSSPGAGGLSSSPATYPTAILPVGTSPKVQAALIATNNCLSTFVVECDGPCFASSSASAPSTTSTSTSASSTSTTYAVTLTLGPSLYEIPVYTSVYGEQYVASVICSLAPKLASAVCTTYQTYHQGNQNSLSTVTNTEPRSVFAPVQVPITFGGSLLGTPWSDCVPTTTGVSGTTRTTSSPTSTATSLPSQLSTGAKAGIGAGVGVAGVAVLAMGAWFFLRRRKKSGTRVSKDEEPKDDPNILEHDEYRKVPPAELEHSRGQYELPGGNERHEMQVDERAGEMGRMSSTRGAQPGIESRHELPVDNTD